MSGLKRGVRRGLAALRGGFESVARATGLESEVSLAELPMPWLELLVDGERAEERGRIGLRLGWNSAMAPPCLCPSSRVTAELTGARMVGVARGGIFVATEGKVPIPALRCATAMVFWFEPEPGWDQLEEVRAAVDDGRTRFEFTTLRPGVRGALRLVDPPAGPLPRGGWIELAATVAGHSPGEIRTIRWELPGAPAQAHAPVGFDVAFPRDRVRFRLPSHWEGSGTLTIDAAMHSQVDDARGARVQRVRSAATEPQRFAVEIAARGPERR